MKIVLIGVALCVALAYIYAYRHGTKMGGGKNTVGL